MVKFNAKDYVFYTYCVIKSIFVKSPASLQNKRSRKIIARLRLLKLKCSKRLRIPLRIRLRLRMLLFYHTIAKSFSSSELTDSGAAKYI